MPLFMAKAAVHVITECNGATQKRRLSTKEGYPFHIPKKSKSKIIKKCNNLSHLGQ